MPRTSISQKLACAAAMIAVIGSMLVAPPLAGAGKAETAEATAGAVETDQGATQVNSEVAQVNSEVAQVNSEVAQVNSEVAQVNSEVAPANSEVAPANSKAAEVVASTTWTAVIAKAAGAQSITVLAPAELRHPPEYDFRASDIAKVAGSAILVWGGYEPFIQRLIQAAGVPDERVVQITTVNTPDDIKTQSRFLSERLGTTEAQQAWEREFDKLAADIRSHAESSAAGEIRTLAHFHQQAFARWLGYNVIGVFGPDELSPARVAELAQLKPDLIVDNYHNPQALAIEEIANCRRAELRNFPATEADTIEMLLLDNVRKLGLDL